MSSTDIKQVVREKYGEAACKVIVTKSNPAQAAVQARTRSMRGSYSGCRCMLQGTRSVATSSS
jgi:hypothetical protein